MRNSDSSPTISNCTFSGNTAYYGGGMCNYDSHGLTVTNCTFSGNTATNKGGGIYNWGSNPTITNSTFSGNTATINGGGMCNWSSSSPTVTNCIVWNNSPSEIYNNTTTPVVVSYSIIKGGFTGTGNLNKDPLFVLPVDISSVPVTEGDLHLQATSPAIDMGSNADVPSGIITDRDGSPRIVGYVVDMGAYEFILPGDVNGDKILDLKDAILALKVVAGIAGNTAINLFADVNGDGKIGMEEAVYVLQNVGIEG